MFGEDFLGLRELGITSELGVSNISIPKKLLRPKGTRMGTGTSLPYVKPLLVFLVCPLICATRICSAEASQRNLPHPSLPLLRLSHSSQHGWNPKLLDYCDHTTSLVSTPLHNLKWLHPNPLSLPQRLPRRSEALRNYKLHHLSPDNCCNYPSIFQHYLSRLSNNLRDLNHHQYSYFQTMHQPLLKQRWARSGRSPAGNRQTPPRRRNKRRRKILRSPDSAAATFLVP